jgi:hypothetical protein
LVGTDDQLIVQLPTVAFYCTFTNILSWL